MGFNQDELEIKTMIEDKTLTLKKLDEKLSNLGSPGFLNYFIQNYKLKNILHYIKEIIKNTKNINHLDSESKTALDNAGSSHFIKKLLIENGAKKFSDLTDEEKAEAIGEAEESPDVGDEGVAEEDDAKAKEADTEETVSDEEETEETEEDVDVDEAEMEEEMDEDVDEEEMDEDVDEEETDEAETEEGIEEEETDKGVEEEETDENIPDVDDQIEEEVPVKVSPKRKSESKEKIQCQGMKKKGIPCKLNAKQGSKYCIHHKNCEETKIEELVDSIVDDQDFFTPKNSSKKILDEENSSPKFSSTPSSSPDKQTSKSSPSSASPSSSKKNAKKCMKEDCDRMPRNNDYCWEHKCKPKKGSSKLETPKETPKLETETITPKLDSPLDTPPKTPSPKLKFSKESPKLETLEALKESPEIEPKKSTEEYQNVEIPKISEFKELLPMTIPKMLITDEEKIKNIQTKNKPYFTAAFPIVLKENIKNMNKKTLLDIKKYKGETIQEYLYSYFNIPLY